MAFDWEKNLDYSSDFNVDFKKEYKNLKKEVSLTATNKESKEQYNSLKVYEVKNISDIWFGKSSACSTGENNLHFAVNWPLVGTDWEPVGWFINKWIMKKSFVVPKNLYSKDGWNFDVDNWIFWLWQDWKLKLIPYKEFNNSINFKWAFQNWPMLVHNGKDMRKNSKSTSKYNRSGIWFTSSWKAIVIYSDEPVTMKKFSKLFVDRWCNNAIYLDWWPYAWYADPTGSYWQLNSNAKKLQFFHQN